MVPVFFLKRSRSFYFLIFFQGKNFYFFHLRPISAKPSYLDLGFDSFPFNNYKINLLYENFISKSNSCVSIMCSNFCFPVIFRYFSHRRSNKGFLIRFGIYLWIIMNKIEEKINNKIIIKRYDPILASKRLSYKFSD